MVRSLVLIGWLVVWFAVRLVDTGFYLYVVVKEIYRFLVGVYSYFNTLFLEDIPYTLFDVFSISGCSSYYTQTIISVDSKMFTMVCCYEM